MKRNIFAALATLAIIATAATPAAAAVYPAAMTVTEIRGDVVTLETATGHAYQITGAEDWTRGDVAALIMDDNSTPEITDDRIIDARYSGFTR